MKRFLSLILMLALLLSLMPTGLFGTTASAETTDCYFITYHLDGGSNALKNPDVYTAEDTITLMDATKVGYDFAGWFLDSEKTEKITVISGKGNVDIYAKFTPRSFSASFKDGVTLTLKATGYEDYILYLKCGETVDPYSSEIMSKYLTEVQNSTFSSSDPNFSGWFYNANYTYRASGSIDLTTDTTLYCHFSNASSQSATDMFKGNNSVTYYNRDVTKTYRVPTLSNGRLTIDFSIRCYDSDWNQHYAASFTIYNETTGKQLYHKYWPSARVFSRGDMITVSVNPGDVIRCYNGSQGYDTDSTYAQVNFTTERASSVVTSAKIINNTIYYDQSIATPMPINRNGYGFLGWYDSNGNKIADTWEYTENQTFTPKWRPTQYYISYDLNGGTNSPANPSSYTIDDTVTLKDPTKPGYTFKGWYSDANFKTQVTSISNKTGNITLYAKWEANSYNLTLDASTGVFAPKVTFLSDNVEIKSCYLYGQDTITAYRPTGKDGYIFAGWYTDDTFTSLFKFNGTITNDITLYAKWVECNSNIVNIESAGNVNTTIQGKTEQLYAFVPLVDGKITVTSESNDLDLYGILYDASKKVLTSADDISSTDLDFTYTCSVKAGQLYYITVKGTTASTAGQAVVNIVWTGNCTITGTTYQNRQVTIAYDTNYKLPQKPIRDGFVFQGWFDENGMQVTDGTWNFVTDKTLTAKWEEATYHTVVFKDLAGNVISSEMYYLSEDIVAPELPTKAPDNTYIYHAKWDNDYTGICTGDAVYSPTFDTEYIEYTVIFVDEDGTELSRATYHWGDVVTVPAAPAKVADITYIYAFNGWDNVVTECAGDATYTATYIATYIEYTVKFLNEDGSTISEKTYHWGDKISIPADPTKAADNTYTYTFAAWDKEVVNCAGDATYTATYTSAYNDYTVTFKNWDGSVISTKTYHYGDKVSVPADPSKVADKTCTYAFIGWDKTITTVTGDTVYTAAYAPVYISYTVIFQNYDGTVLSKQFCHYGDPVSIPGDSTRYTDETYTYAFAGWDSEVTKCYGDKVYTATYTPTYRDYVITFINYDGSLISEQTYHYGDIVIPPADPIRASSNTYKYTFQGWNSTVTACTGNKTYTAVYTSEHIDYTIVFKNYDGTVISSAVYHYGDSVVAPTPTVKPADNKYTYIFAGWDKNVVNCAGDATYTATYTPVFIDYTVVFKDWNGDVLSTETYHFGDKVTAPNDPTKAADNIYTYTFAGWDKEVVNCAGNATYTATYTPTYIDYTVVFKDWNGVLLSSEAYHYGDKITAPTNPTKEADNTYIYTFAGWDKAVVNCAGDATYTAIYTSTYKDYTVVFKDEDGTVLSTKTYHWGDQVIAPTNPTKPTDNTYTYTFAGWDKEVVNCTDNATYTAIYTSTYKDYTVVFKDEDGTVLSTKTYHWGDKVTAPANPTKAADNIYTYAFAGWDKEVVNCAGNATYTATYNSTYIDYTVVFKDWNSNLLSTKTYHWGDQVTLPADPTRAADNTYTYAFTGWDKSVVSCAGDAVYTATYDHTFIDYTVVFKNWDGSEISSTTYRWGDTITVPENPVRANDKEYAYSFTGWDQEITACDGNKVYTATYKTWQFADVSTSSWQIGAVVYACDRGLMAGKGMDASGNIKFDPNSPITREEFVQVLYNAEGKPSVSFAKDFPDVADNGWYKNAVMWANQAGIASGMGDGRFGVGKNITRQDLAMMLYKYAKLKGCSLDAEAGKINGFADGSKVADYAKTAMDWAVTNGVLSGKGEAGKPISTFRLDPTGTATRAECAAMLKNFMTAFGL